MAAVASINMAGIRSAASASDRAAELVMVDGDQAVVSRAWLQGVLEILQGKPFVDVSAAGAVPMRLAPIDPGFTGKAD